MKFSVAQLDLAIGKMKNCADDPIEVEFVIADPGNGTIVDMIKLTGKRADSGTSETVTTIEVFPYADKVEPIATQTKTFTVTNKY